MNVNDINDALGRALVETVAAKPALLDLSLCDMSLATLSFFGVIEQRIGWPWSLALRKIMGKIKEWQVHNRCT